MSVANFEKVFNYTPSTLFSTKHPLTIVAFEADKNCAEGFMNTIGRNYRGETGREEKERIRFEFIPSPASASVATQTVSKETDADRLVIVILNPAWTSTSTPVIDGVKLADMTAGLVGTLEAKKQRRVALLVVSKPGHHKPAIDLLLAQKCSDSSIRKHHDSPALPRYTLGAISIDTITFS